MPKVKTVVYRENTLGILRGNMIEVLNGLVSKGGKSFSDSPFFVYEEEIRPATMADFDTFDVRYHPHYEIQQVSP